MRMANKHTNKQMDAQHLNVVVGKTLHWGWRVKGWLLLIEKSLDIAVVVMPGDRNTRNEKSYSWRYFCGIVSCTIPRRLKVNFNYFSNRLKRERTAQKLLGGRRRIVCLCSKSLLALQ